MKMNLYKDSRGIARLKVIVVVVVIVAIGAAGYYVYNKTKTSNNPNLAGKTTAEKTAIKETETACMKAYNDKDFCKFASSFNPTGPYKMTVVTTDKSGKTIAMAIEIDGKNNTSMITKDGTNETSAYIQLNGDTYMKNEDDGSWLKTPKSTDTTPTSTPTSDLKFDSTEFSKPAEQRATVKRLGKDSCGKFTCIKYSLVEPNEKTKLDGVIWIGDKDFQLHKMSYKDTDGNTFVGEFSFEPVTITAPTPVKEMPATPSTPDIQALEQSISAGGAQQ